VASQRVEDVRSVRGLQVREHEEAARSGGDDFVLAEKREVLAQDAPGGGVQDEALVVLEDLVHQDPPARVEAEVGRIALGVFGGRAPACANGAEVHIAVHIVGGEEAVRDVAQKLGRQGRPVWPHGRMDWRGFGVECAVES
jgi:hypothetical protein